MTAQRIIVLGAGVIGPRRNEEQARQHESAPDEPASAIRAEEGDEVDKFHRYLAMRYKPKSKIKPGKVN